MSRFAQRITNSALRMVEAEKHQTPKRDSCNRWCGPDEDCWHDRETWACPNCTDGTACEAHVRQHIHKDVKDYPNDDYGTHGTQVEKCACGARRQTDHESGVWSMWT